MGKKALRPGKCPKCEYKNNRNLINTKRIMYTDMNEIVRGYESYWECFHCGYKRINQHGTLNGNKKTIYIKF